MLWCIWLFMNIFGYLILTYDRLVLSLHCEYLPYQTFFLDLKGIIDSIALLDLNWIFPYCKTFYIWFL